MGRCTQLIMKSPYIGCKRSLFREPSLILSMLVSALMGPKVMKEAYAHAIENGYRHYSYRDSSLLLPQRT